MTVLVNASNLVIGGGIQVGVWFIQACLENQFDAHFAISPQIARELSLLGIDTTSDTMHVFESSPAKSKLARQQLKQLSHTIHADVVFTVFGPAYVTFEQPHLSGFADGWVSHSQWHNFKRAVKHSFVDGIKLALTCVYKAIAIRQANEWVFETQVAADGLAKRSRLPKHRCHVIANNCNQRFFEEPVKPLPHEEVFKLLYLAADYPHKGVKKFIDYARELQKLAPDQAFQFVISLNDNSASAQFILNEAKKEGLEAYFNFCGHVAIDEVIERIDLCHVMMQMSHLETFSANYPEAMARQRALLVSDYTFARDICDNAAWYVDPDNAEDVAKAIVALKSDPTQYSALVDAGKEVLARFPTPKQRFEKYAQIITRMKAEK